MGAFVAGVFWGVLDERLAMIAEQVMERDGNKQSVRMIESDVAATRVQE